MYYTYILNIAFHLLCTILLPSIIQISDPHNTEPLKFRDSLNESISAVPSRSEL